MKQAAFNMGANVLSEGINNVVDKVGG